MQESNHHAYSQDLLGKAPNHSITKFERALVLILTSFMLFGDGYAYDVPYAVKDDMRAQFPGLSKLDFDYLYDDLYTFYCIPNIFLPLVNGFIGLKFGVRKLLTFYLLFNVLGQFIIALGDYFLSFPIMILGRSVYGLGGESLLVFQWTYITQFITKQQAGIAAAMTNLALEISESANLYLSPRISQALGVISAFFITGALCFTDLIARFCLIPIENKHKIENQSQATRTNQGFCPRKEDLKISKLGWIVIFFGLVTSAGHYGFFYFSSDYIIYEWYGNLSPEDAQNEASYYTSLSYLVYSMGILGLGWLADKFQLYVHFAILAPVLLSLSYFLMTVMHPLVPFVVLGIATTLADVSLWSCLNQAVGEDKIIMASALVVSISNASQAVIQDLNTFLYSFTKSYMAVIGFYHVMNVIGLGGAVWFGFKMKEEKKKIAEEDKSELKCYE